MELDIVNGLEAGGDDYITKPFSLAVLRARVGAVLRRRESNYCADRNTIFTWQDFRFDFENMIFCHGNMRVELSKTEQKLLRVLVSNAGITISREKLIDRIWTDGAEFVEENALSVTMKRLREKLPGIPVKTVYGIGYVWEKLG
ncbi:MAG: response regulator transcription factor [Anaerovoracaceae bacterium]